MFCSAPPQGLPDHRLCHLPCDQEQSRRSHFLLFRPLIPLSLLATTGDASTDVLQAGGAERPGRRRQRGTEEEAGLYCRLHLLLLLQEHLQELLLQSDRWRSGLHLTRSPPRPPFVLTENWAELCVNVVLFNKIILLSSVHH